MATTIFLNDIGFLPFLSPSSGAAVSVSPSVRSIPLNDVPCAPRFPSRAASRVGKRHANCVFSPRQASPVDAGARSSANLGAGDRDEEVRRAVRDYTAE